MDGSSGEAAVRAARFKTSLPPTGSGRGGSKYAAKWTRIHNKIADPTEPSASAAFSPCSNWNSGLKWEVFDLKNGTKFALSRPSSSKTQSESPHFQIHWIIGWLHGSITASTSPVWPDSSLVSGFFSIHYTDLIFSRLCSRAMLL